MGEFRYPTIDLDATGRNLRRHLESAGLSVLDVQAKLNFASQQSVYAWLNGRSLPSLDNLYAVSDLLNVPMDELIVGDRRTGFSWRPAPSGDTEEK